MERVVEPDARPSEYAPEIEEETDLEEVEVVWSLQSEECTEVPHRGIAFYGKVMGSIALMLLLPFAPVFTLPGVFVLVLLTEVYLVDWTYSRVREIRGKSGDIRLASNPEDEVDKQVTRDAQKKQFSK